MVELSPVNIGSLPNDNTGDELRTAWQKLNTNDAALNAAIVALEGSIGGVEGNAQPLDADLTAISGLTTTGMMARTSSATYTMRTITGTSGQVTLTNGNGVAGNPTISLANSGVTAGSYTRANVTVDAFGRITGASNGTTDITLDTAPVLGGNLSLGTFGTISTSGNTTITLDPGGSGTIGLAANTAVTGSLSTTTSAAVGTTLSVGSTLAVTSNATVGGNLAVTGDLDVVDIRSTGGALFTSTNTGSGFGPHLDLHRNSASPAVNDTIGQISFSGEDSASNKTEYGRINTVIATTTNGSEDGTLVLESITGGSYPSVPQLQITARPVCTGVGTSALIVDRRSNDGVLVSWRQNDVGVGSVTVDGSLVSYETFTGSHYAEWLDPDLIENPPPRGTWLETTKEPFLMDGNDREGLCKVRIAQPGSKRVAGVYLSDLKDDDGNRKGILVSAIGGPFMARFKGPATGGAFVEISDTPGVAKAQAGNYLTVHTCAKIWREDDATGERLLSIILNCG